MKKEITGANPYMPLWEHVPDGEPRLFKYNGEERVYVYGSHDTIRTDYCGVDYVVWSAPADDLTNWRCDGICYRSSNGNPLYAPDVVEKDGRYYMYVAEDRGTTIYVASSDSPTGPFEDPVLTDMGFDPGVLVDDDGRIYGYWGFCACFAAELNDDMATIKEATLVEHMLPHTMPLDIVKDPDYDHIDSKYCFFEASSIRKVMGKYVYIYSQRINKAEPENGFPAHTNSYLSYAYSDDPLSGWKYGGKISYNCGDMYMTSEGERSRAYYHCNNHGSIVDVHGQWYVFYHRQTGTDQFARQGMLEPIDAAVDKNGRVYLGSITYNSAGEPVANGPVEMTSQGAFASGIDAYGILSAGYACYITPAENGDRAYIKPVYEGYSAPVINIKSGTVVGFKYMNFGDVPPAAVTVKTDGFIRGKIIITADSPNGIKLAELDACEETVSVVSEITGKHAVYFTFVSDDKNCSVCTFDVFTFDQ